MPLHLLLGLRTSLTPSAALQRRRTSPGMSLKYRHCSFGFQIGPSVNLNPVHSFSTATSLSISLSISGDLISTELMESFIPFFNLPERQAHPVAGCAQHQFTKIFISALLLRKTICWPISRVKLGTQNNLTPSSQDIVRAEQAFPCGLDHTF